MDMESILPYLIIILAAALAVTAILMVMRGNREKEDGKFTEDGIYRRMSEGRQEFADVPGIHSGTLTLTLRDINAPGRYFECPLDAHIIVGRNRNLCNIVIDYDHSVSRQHCEIFMEGNQIKIKDLDSSNGTFLDGRQVFETVPFVPGVLSASEGSALKPE